jgi:hypothetical protein
VTIQSQKKAFSTRGTAMKKMDMIQVQEYEENQKFSDYMLGIA